jgi:hypothetical protein
MLVQINVNWHNSTKILVQINSTCHNSTAFTAGYARRYTPNATTPLPSRPQRYLCNAKYHNSTAFAPARRRLAPIYSRRYTPTATTPRPSRPQEGVLRQDTHADTHQKQQIHCFRAHKKASRAKILVQIHAKCRNSTAFAPARKLLAPRYSRR